MKTSTAFLISIAAIVTSVGTGSAETIAVDDASEAALNAALTSAANSDTASRIVLGFSGDMTIASSLTYTGTAPVAIIGSGQTISTQSDVTLLEATNGADLHVVGLTLEGPGGFDIDNRGDADGSAGKGIFVDVRDDQTGTVTLSLDDVTVRGVANHGIHVSDCTLADACGGGQSGEGAGAEAEIRVNLTNVTVEDVGNGTFDADGLRVDERADGSITAVITDSTFVNVGADGTELDEGGDGDIVATIVGSRFNDNGGYCDPDILSGFLPDPDEGEFEAGTTQEDAIPGPVTGSPDDSCIEREVDRYDDGSVEAYEFGIDLDDGIDFDEGDDGSIVAVFLRSTINGNLDEGVDFDEAGDGDITVSFIDTDASGNTDDGYKNSEEDDGSVIGQMVRSTARDNGGKGAVFEEEGDGDLSVIAKDTITSNNDDGDDTGIEAVQEDEGQGELRLLNSTIDDGTDLDGVQL